MGPQPRFWVRKSVIRLRSFSVIPSPMDEFPLVVENLSFRYRRRTEPAIEGVSFVLKPGQVMLVAGSSGCGKTTLMRCINGLIPHTYHGEMSGDIRLYGQSLMNMHLVDISQKVGTL